MRLVLLGATGYLGSHVAEQLLLAGHKPLCIVRIGSDLSFLKSIHASIQTIDFSELTALEHLIDESSVVINCIADTRPHASYAQRAVVEIALTQALFQLAQKQGVQRFIQLSTVMVYGFSRPAMAVDEHYAQSPTHIYNQVAADREKALIDSYQEELTELLILRPSNTIGKRDSSFLPSFVSANKYGIFPVVDGGRWQFSCVDARDVGRAMAHLLTVEVSRPEVFLLKGFDTDWLSFKIELERYLAKKTHVFNMPKSIMYPLARLFEWLVPYGRMPPLTRFDLDVLSTDTLFDDAKIRASGFLPKYQLIDSFKDALPQK